MIKTVIFDFGNVLGNFDHMITCKGLSAFSIFSAEDIYEKIFKSKIKSEYDKGMLSFSKFYKKICKVIRANNLSLEAFEKIWGDIFSENFDIIDVIEKIDPNITLFVLSNTNEVHWKYINKLPVIKKFFQNPEKLLLSYLVNIRKPQKEIFIKAIKKSKCHPNEILFIDDVKEFTMAFQVLGGKSAVYNCTKDNINHLIKVLNKYDILIK